MDRVSDHDDDIDAWTQEQAVALRRLAATCPDLPNDLHVAHIAEEIDGVGTSELRAIKSSLGLVLRHLLNIASAPEARAVRHWHGEMRLHHRALVRDDRPSTRRILDLDGAWRAACARADAALDEHGDALLAELPATCPSASTNSSIRPSIRAAMGDGTRSGARRALPPGPDQASQRFLRL